MPLLLWKGTGNSTLSHLQIQLRRGTHHMCSQSNGQSIARCPCITTKEPWEFKLCPQGPHAQRILGGVYEHAQRGQLIALPQTVWTESNDSRCLLILGTVGKNTVNLAWNWERQQVQLGAGALAIPTRRACRMLGPGIGYQRTLEHEGIYLLFLCFLQFSSCWQFSACGR